MKLAVGRARQVFGFFPPFLTSCVQLCVFSPTTLRGALSSAVHVTRFWGESDVKAGRLWFLSIPGRFRLKWEPFMFSTEVSQKLFFFSSGCWEEEL